MFRFVHTADLHLDAPLKSLALKDPDLFDLVGNATRRALERIVDLCLEEEVNALMIAGDLYDGDMRSMKTAAFLVGQMERLSAAGVAVFMIRGNHDAESVLTRELEFPPNVHVFTGHGGTVELPESGVAVHGVSFAKPQAPESLLPKYKPPVSGLFNIGLLHTSLAGASGHDTYAPCSVNDLIAHGFDYWALGHIHIRQVHAETPHVVMPGMPQGRDIGEAGPKSVTLVTVDKGTASLEDRVTSPVEFARQEVTLDGVDDWRDALREIGAAIASAAMSLSDHSVLRLELVGETPLAWRLRRDQDLLLEQVANLARAQGSVWIDKIVHRLSAPSQAAKGEDPRRELAALMSGLLDDDAFMERAAREVGDIIGDLPAELRNVFGETEAEEADQVRALLREGAEDITARVMSGEAEEPS
ncbi:metallophosphoesterase family protein [Ovoidimarina sediminis]|uniref:metallophosphoesterase family protein n=1 Tax=Ovoidimarina sediminis TaxID=3079856 RepID=UPI00290DDB0A|nr:DNA repair exonuclease [Rhodophyticola sp. MJ-SS7]MDU8946745.1 DNA repair exonuclease [Rhodophyticola sp. MJ-SS7]